MFEILAPFVVIWDIIQSDDIHPLLELERDTRTDDLFAFLKCPRIIFCS
jgi:hypothetical protein